MILDMDKEKVNWNNITKIKSRIWKNYTRGNCANIDIKQDCQKISICFTSGFFFNQKFKKQFIALCSGRLI